MPARFPIPVHVHFNRPGKGATVYTEYLLEDTAIGLRTFREIPLEARGPLTDALRRISRFRPDQIVSSARKHYFYHEHFDVLEFFDQAGQLIGYYSDITTPLTRVNGAYQLTDLFLDLWVAPDQPVRELLDLDEFQTAVAQGWVTPEQQHAAQATFERLRHEASQQIFPFRYLGNDDE